jgi:hypothetical protein
MDSVETEQHVSAGAVVPPVRKMHAFRIGAIEVLRSWPSMSSIGALTGRVIDVLVSARRDADAARRFFHPPSTH